MPGTKKGKKTQYKITVGIGYEIIKPLHMPENTHCCSKQQGASCSSVCFLHYRRITDCRQWCNPMQQIGVCTLDIFYNHVSCLFVSCIIFRSHMHDLLTEDLSAQSEGKCGLFPLEVPHRCHTSGFLLWMTAWFSLNTIASLFLTCRFLDVSCLCKHKRELVKTHVSPLTNETPECVF